MPRAQRQAGSGQHPNIPRPQAPQAAPAAGTPTFPSHKHLQQQAPQHSPAKSTQVAPAAGTHHPVPGAIPGRCRKEMGRHPQRGGSEASWCLFLPGPAASPQEGQVGLPAAEARSPRPSRGVCALLACSKNGDLQRLHGVRATMIQRTQFLDQHVKKNQRELPLLAANAPGLESGLGAAQHLGASAMLRANTSHGDSKPRFSDPRRETSFRVIFC